MCASSGGVSAVELSVVEVCQQWRCVSSGGVPAVELSVVDVC